MKNIFLLVIVTLFLISCAEKPKTVFLKNTVNGVIIKKCGCYNTSQAVYVSVKTKTDIIKLYFKDSDKDIYVYLNEGDTIRTTYEKKDISDRVLNYQTEKVEVVIDSLYY